MYDILSNNISLVKHTCRGCAVPCTIPVIEYEEETSFIVQMNKIQSLNPDDMCFCVIGYYCLMKKMPGSSIKFAKGL